jgi:serine/threonine protein kinase/WD40 repeat protein
MGDEQHIHPSIEVLRRGQRAAWQAGNRILVEEYLREFPELGGDSEAILELIYNELLLRQRSGETPDLQKFNGRFPALAVQMEFLFELHLALDESAFSTSQNEETLPDAGSPLRTAPATFPVIPGLQVIRELGRGGSSVVFEAQQFALHRRVALKMMLAGSCAGPEQRSRFHIEAQVLARLHHPHIVPVYQVGEHDGQLFLLMEYVRGGSLAQYLGGRTLPFQQAARLVEKLARAIHYAHQNGVIHRDLKPANILLQESEVRSQRSVVSGQRSGVGGQMSEVRNQKSDRAQATVPDSDRCSLTSDLCPMITDFGLAKFLERDWPQSNQGEPTQTGTILGTAGYMAPEQAAGHSRDIGPAADIHALGAILFELLTGRRRFRGTTPFEILREVQTVDPIFPSEARSRLPRDLRTICLKCLRKEPGNRYASAELMAEDLDRFLAGKPIRARRVGALEKAWRWSRRNPGWASAFATVAGLLLIIACGALLWSVDRERALTLLRDAEGDAANKLYLSRISEAQARTLSRRPGQRFRSLAVLDEASQQARELKLPAKQFKELRDAATAALLVPDLNPLPALGDSPVGASSFSDDLTVHACCDRAGNCSVRSLDSDREICPTILGAGYSPTLSRDGHFLAVHNANQRTTVWKLAAAGPQKLLTVESSGICQFHPTLPLIAFTQKDGAIELYDLAQERQLPRLAPGAPNREPVIALHPVEALIAVSCYYTREIEIRNLFTGAVERTLELPQGCSYLAWHPSGRWLAVSEANGPKIHLFDWKEPGRVRQLGPIAGGGQLFFNHAGDRLAVYDWSNSVKLFDVNSGALVFQIPYVGHLAKLSFSADDARLAGFVENGRVGFWQVADGREYRQFSRGRADRKNHFLSPAVSADGALLALATVDGVCIWDLQSGLELACLNVADALLAEFEGRDTLLIGDSTGVYRWPLVRDRTRPGLARLGPPVPLPLPPGGSMARSAQGTTLAVAGRTVGSTAPFAGAWVLHPDHKGVPQNLDAGEDMGWVALHPDGNLVATMNFQNGDVKIWDAPSGSLKRLLGKGSHGPLQFSPDGRSLIVVAERSQFYSTSDWRLEREVTGSIRLAPDGGTFAQSTGNHEIRLIESASGQELVLLEDPDRHATSDLLFTPDGSKLIAVDRDRGAHVWDLRLLRRQLAERGLDWEGPGYPPAVTGSELFQLEIDWGSYPHLRQQALAENYERTTRAGPHLPLRWHYRALFHLRANRLELAKRDLEKTVDLAPDSASACNMLAWICVTGPEKLRDPSRGVTLAQHAVKLEPRDWTYMNTLGIAYYRAGRFHDAVRSLEACASGRSGESDAFDLYFLALSHHQLGETGKARAAWSQASAWHEQNRKALTSREAEELQGFRTEAEKVFGETAAAIPGNRPK